MSKFPKRLYVVEDNSDNFTHGGHANVQEAVINTARPTHVGVYQLVKTEWRQCVEVVKLVDPPTDEDEDVE